MINKKASLKCQVGFLAMCEDFYSSGLIAPVGQTSSQVPQSVQVSGFTLKMSPSSIAPTGHSPWQAPHAIQSSEIL